MIAFRRNARKRPGGFPKTASKNGNGARVSRGLILSGCAHAASGRRFFDGRIPPMGAAMLFWKREAPWRCAGQVGEASPLGYPRLLPSPRGVAPTGRSSYEEPPDGVLHGVSMGSPGHFTGFPRGVSPASALIGSLSAGEVGESQPGQGEDGSQTDGRGEGLPENAGRGQHRDHGREVDVDVGFHGAQAGNGVVPGGESRAPRRRGREDACEEGRACALRERRGAVTLPGTNPPQCVCRYPACPLYPGVISCRLV